MAIAEIWNQQAACRGLDPEIFYPVSEEEAAHAKAVCGQCAVQQACLEHALGVPGAGRCLGRRHGEGAATNHQAAASVQLTP